MNESGRGLFDAADDFPTVRVGIVTALPAECAAARSVINDLRHQPAPGDPNHYRCGWLPSTEPDRPHRVVVALQAQDGTRNAASICTDMARSFPGLGVFVMCGVAGGVPAPEQPGRHVRLGDIVVATKGVVDYDHVRAVDGQDTLRRPLEGLSTALLRADRELETKELENEQPWRLPLGDLTAKIEWFRRPPDETDQLYIGDRPAQHPDRRESGHPIGWPRVHRGAIGSADRLLRDAVRRDLLARDHGILALEMEGSGIAVSADLHDRHWFMVRGVADYCDDITKNDVWHRYAAVAAAAYVRALLAECKPFAGTPYQSAPSPASRLHALVDALLSLPPMRDDYQRRAILAQLPERIRTAVPDSVTARLHVLGLIQTCEQFPDGADRLLDALRLAIGPTSPGFSRVEAIIRNNWTAG